MNAIKNMLRQPTAQQLAVKELAEAERQLLEAETAKEYATQMVVYHAGRVARLRKYLATMEVATA